MVRGPMGWQQERLGAQEQSRVGSNKTEPVIWRKPVIKAETGTVTGNQTRCDHSKAGTPSYKCYCGLVRGLRWQAFLEWALGRRRWQLIHHHSPFFPDVGVGGDRILQLWLLGTHTSQDPSVRGASGVLVQYNLISGGELGVR